MALPKQVQKQIADAKRIEGELRAAEPPAPADPVVAPVAAVESTPVAPVVAASATPEPAPAAPTPAQQVTAAQHEALLQQYRTLQGIHRTLARENGNMQSELQTLRTSVQSITAEVEQLRQRPAAPAPSAPVISDAEITEFGPDLISVIERKAQQVAAPLNEALAKANSTMETLARRNAELEQSLKGVSTAQAQSVKADFAASVYQLVPDFNAMNNDQNFLAWLSQVDPLDARRRTLQERLDEAVGLQDAGTVAGFFNTFKSLVRQAPTPAPAPAPKNDLSAQAQPMSRAAPDNAPPSTGKIWSGAEINAFYDGVTRNKYSQAEKIRIEKDIYAAQKENRVAA